VYIQSLNSAPTRRVVAVATQALGNERARVRNVRETRVYGERPGIIDEIIDGLCVFC
jgi:hypothetical protein